MIALAWLACLTAGIGCSYNNAAADYIDPYVHGDVARAAEKVSSIARKAGGHNKVLFLLEQGAIRRAAGDLPGSNAAFSAADAIISDFDRQAEVSVSAETAAALTNLTVMRYDGYAYDRIMMNTYQALNYMELGDYDGARVELFRAYDRQRQAAERFQKQIEANEALKRKPQKGDYNVQAAESDPAFRQGIESRFGDIMDFRGYADYVNPFSEYLQGLFFMATAADQSDRERAATSFKRVAGMVDGNPYLGEDIALAERVAGGAPVPPTTYILFETGMAPRREEIRIDIPLFIFDSRVDYIGAAFPTLVGMPDAVDYLDVNTSDRSYRTALVCDMEAVIRQEFRDIFPMIVTRTLIATGVKAAIAYTMNHAARDEDASVQILVRLLMIGYQAGTTHADLRTWRTLPREFQVCRFPTPPDRRLMISLSNGMMLPPLALNEGVVNVVYVKSIRAGVPPIVRQFSLNRGTL